MAALSLTAPLAKVFATAEDVSKKAGDSFVTVERCFRRWRSRPRVHLLVAQKGRGAAQALNQAINDIRKGRTADSANADRALMR